MAEEPLTEGPQSVAEQLVAEEPVAGQQGAERQSGDELQTGEPETQEAGTWDSLGARTATLAGVAAFVVGGTGTVLAAIGDFGADSGPLAAARRNHVNFLIAAACLAAVGLFLGALYTLLRSQIRHVEKEHREELRWATIIVLAAGVLSVAAGVALGATATTKREAGRPFIEVQRVDPSSVRVTISGEGLSSDDWFEALVDGFGDDSSPDVPLAAGRFSPLQDGRLHWRARFLVPKKLGKTTITRLIVRVQKNKVAGEDCTTDADLTCLSIRIPRRVVQKSTPQSQTSTP